MCLLFGVVPVLCERVPEHRSEFGEMALQEALDMRLASPGSAVVLIGGKPLTDPRSTNTIALRYIPHDAEAKQFRERPHHATATS